MKQKKIHTIITMIIIISIILTFQQNNVDISKAGLSNENIEKYDKEKINKIDDLLEITVETDKTKYNWIKDPVKIKVTIENQGDTVKTLTFPTTKQHDFIIKNSHGIAIFTWSENLGFSQVFTELTLIPGENKSWNYSWYQCGHLFPFLPSHTLLPGSYTIIASIPSLEKTYQQEIQIKTGIFLKKLF